MRNRVREQRRQRGLSQAEVAAALGVSRQTVISIESGRYLPSLPLAFLRPPSVVPAFLAPAFLDAVAVAPRFPGAPVAVTGAAGLDCASDWPDRRVDDCPPPCLDCAPPCLDCALAAWRPFDEARDPLMRA